MYKLGKILPSIFEKLGIDDGVKLRFLRKKWGEIFSAPITEHTYPREIKGEVLYVNVNSHAWLSELRLMKDEFLKKLYPYGISNVEFRFGRIYNQKEKLTDSKSCVSLSNQQSKLIDQILEKIHDEEIKKVLKDAMIKHFYHVNKTLRGEQNERI